MTWKQRASQAISREVGVHDKIGLIDKDPSAAAISSALCTLEILDAHELSVVTIFPREGRMTAIALEYSRSWMPGDNTKAVAAVTMFPYALEISSFNIFPSGHTLVYHHHLSHFVATSPVISPLSK